MTQENYRRDADFAFLRLDCQSGFSDPLPTDNAGFLYVFLPGFRSNENVIDVMNYVGDILEQNSH